MFSFSQRKKLLEVQPQIVRLLDLTTPNLSKVNIGNTRAEKRFNRTLPTLICPWEDGGPVIDECTSVLTSDFSDRGVGLVLSQPLHASGLVLGFWIRDAAMPEPFFFLGNQTRLVPIGGGFWSIGVELTEFANTRHGRALDILMPEAERLLPQDLAASS